MLVILLLVHCSYRTPGVCLCQEEADKIVDANLNSKVQSLLFSIEDDYRILSELDSILADAIACNDLSFTPILENWLVETQARPNLVHSPCWYQKQLLATTALCRLHTQSSPLTVTIKASNNGVGTRLLLPQLNVEIENTDKSGRPVFLPLGGGEFNEKRQTYRVLLEVSQNNTSILTRKSSQLLRFGGRINYVTLRQGEKLTYSISLHDYVRPMSLGEAVVQVEYRPYRGYYIGSETLFSYKSEPCLINIVPSEPALTKAEVDRLEQLLDQLPTSGPITIVKGRYGQWADEILPATSVPGQILGFGDAAFPSLLNRLQNTESEFERGWILAMLHTLSEENDPTLDRKQNILGNYILGTSDRTRTVDAPNGQGHVFIAPGSADKLYFWYDQTFWHDPRKLLLADTLDEDAKVVVERIREITPDDFPAERTPDREAQLEFSAQWLGWEDAVKIKFEPK